MHRREVQRVLVLILTLNILVAGLKAVFGILAGSMSMVADALHSLFDSVSNIVAIIANFIARKPPDEQHPYGHGKFETLGTLAIGSMLLLSAYWIISEGYLRLTEAIVPEITTITVAVMVLTIGINIFVYRYENGKGKELGSEILLADSTHTKSDIYVSISVLAGFGAISLGFPQADPLVAFVIGGLIGKMGIDIIREAGMILSDSTFLHCENTDIDRIVMGVEGVKGYHNFRCRGRPGEMYADLHITVDPKLEVEQAHNVATEVEEGLKSHIKGMKEIIVHIEPEYIPEE
jgi:cation diffusion facilitator family transporter